MQNTTRRNRGGRAARRLACLLGAGIIGLSCPLTAAATSAQQQKQEAEEALEQANEEAREAEENREAAQAEVNSLNSELTSLLTEITLLELDMDAKQEQIDQAQKDYEAAKAREEQQYEAMKKRIKYMYERGDTEYLDVLLKVKSMSEFLNKSEYIEAIYTYDRKMLTEYQNTKNEVMAYQEQLNNEMADMEVMQLEYQAQQASLEDTIAEKRSEVADFDQQLAQARQEAAAYTRTIEAMNEQIRREEEEARRREEEARRQAEEEARRQQQAQSSSGTTNSSGPTSSGSTSSDGPSSSGPGKTQTTVKSSGGTAQGRAVADYALQFVGNPYVYGGTSLTNGADCSGFVQSVYKHFGITLPRTSGEQRSAGTSVSYSEAQPGDVVCYAGHVGIYIGNGQIVHASSPSTGIKVGNATYRTILSVRRIVQ